MKDLTVTLIQSPLHWNNIEENLKMFSEKISSLKEETDLIVLPEMFNTGFTMNTALAEKLNGRTMQWMSDQAKNNNCVITGSLILEEHGYFFNALIWMEPKGSYHIYHKRHLFRMASEHERFSSGDETIITSINEWNLSPLICYDLRFPAWSRNKWTAQNQNGSDFIPPKAKYDVLLYVANWPEKRSHHWKSLLVARAIENQAFVIGLNRVGKDGLDIMYSGDSMVIDPKGEIIASVNPNEEIIFSCKLIYSQLDELRKNFPVGLDADEYQIKI